MEYDATDLLLNLQTSLDPLYRLATGSAYVIGIIYIFKSLYSLKMYGEARTMMSSNTSMKEPLMHMAIGGLMIYLTTGFGVVMDTTFGYDNILAYDQFPLASGEALSQGAEVLLQVVQVIGAFAFVRGWILLARSTGQGQPGLFGRGMMHIIGGVFGMNIVGTFSIVADTFGIQF